MKVTILQEYEVEITTEMSKEEAIEYINGAYSEIGNELRDHGEYISTTLTEVDGETVLIDGDELSTSARDIVLHGNGKIFGG